MFLIGGSTVNSLSRDGSTGRCYACGQSVGLGPPITAAQGEAPVSLPRSVSPPVSRIGFGKKLNYGGHEESYVGNSYKLI